MQLLVQQIWQGWEAAYWHVPRWYWKSWSSNHTLSCKVVVDASPVWGFLPSDFATVTVCFDIRWFWKYFRSHHAFRSWMEGAIIPLYFPLVVLIKYHDGWFSLFYFFWPVPLLCYVFLLIFHCFRILSVFLSHSAMIFVVVPLLSLVLEILFACLGWLAAPTVFQVLPIFFFFPYERNTYTGWEISALGLYCSHETLAKLFLFRTPHCGWSVCVARLPGSASAPDAMWGPHVGQKRRLREEIRIFWWCWRWCLLPSSVSVPD